MTVRTARILLCAYCAIPAVLVLGPLPVHLLDDTVSAVRAAARLLGDGPGPTRPHVEEVSNVLLFVPIGLVLVPAFPAVARARLLLACLVAAAAMELTQALALADRHPSVRDVALNTAGAALGIVAARRAATGRPSATGIRRGAPSL